MKVAQLLCTAGLVISANTARSSIVFSGNFQTGTGQIEITSPIEVPITISGTLEYFVLDDVLTSGGVVIAAPLSPSISYSLDENPTTGDAFYFAALSTVSFGDLDSNDGGFGFNGGVPVVSGQTFRIEAQTWSGLFGGVQWPSDYNNLTFNGPFFASTFEGNNLSAVPEPSTVGMALAGLAGLWLVRRRQRYA